MRPLLQHHSLAVCTRLGIDDPKLEDSFTLHSLRPFLVELIHENWLVGEQGKYHCPAGLREDILLTAIDDGVFTEYSEASFKIIFSNRIIWACAVAEFRGMVCLMRAFTFFKVRQKSLTMC